MSWAKSLKIAAVALIVLTLAIAAADAVALFYLYSFDRDPKLWTNLNVFYSRPKETPVGALIVRGNDGHAGFAIQYNLSLRDIKPSKLHDCLLAAEDHRFYDHDGMDYLSIFKAVYDHFVHGMRLRGASTISNQLMRTVILADQSRSGLQGIGRKLAETILTGAAERHFSKEDILVSYINNVPIGNLNQTALIGFSAAGEALFGKKDPKRLALSEACTLAGMLNRPNAYLQDANKGDYRSIKERRDKVLENLGRAYPDRYPETAIERSKKENIRFFRQKQMQAAEARQLISYANQHLLGKKPGMRVYLSVDHELQRAAQNAVNEELSRFDHGPYGFYNHLSYLHALKEGRNVSEDESKLQAALVALDAKSGEILAMVGARNSSSEFNRATQAKRAPGSVIKPFVYLYGIQSGLYHGQRFRADTIIDPSINPAAQRYTSGGAASASVQLARSDNGAAVAIAHEFGIPRVREFITEVTGANPVESELLAIGAGKGIELTPLELATAYTIFPNMGLKPSPRSVWAVYDGDTKLDTGDNKNIRIVDAGAALTLARMLQSVIGDGPDGQYGTARMARKLSRLESSVALAGKTGTGDNDLWFVGFTPRIVIVVWVGFDNNYPPFEAAKGFSGSGFPLQIWARFVRDVKKYRSDLLRGSFEMAGGQ